MGKKTITLEVDEETYRILKQMKENPQAREAIINYAKQYLGMHGEWEEEYKEKY